MDYKRRLFCVYPPSMVVFQLRFYKLGQLYYDGDAGGEAGMIAGERLGRSAICDHTSACTRASSSKNDHLDNNNNNINVQCLVHYAFPSLPILVQRLRHIPPLDRPLAYIVVQSSHNKPYRIRVQGHLMPPRTVRPDGHSRKIHFRFGFACQKPW